MSFTSNIKNLKNFRLNKKTIPVIIIMAVTIIGLCVGSWFFSQSNKPKEFHQDRYAELDCTGAASDAFCEAAGFDVRCTGEVFSYWHLTMDNGEFTLELDRELLDAALDTFVYENTDALLKAQLAESGTGTDEASLNEYAVSIGYADWTAAVNATAESLAGQSFDRLVEGEIFYKGTYEIDEKNVATFSDSKDELFTATSEPDGAIVIDYSFDRQAPTFMYDYFRRGVDLVFEKGSTKPDAEGDTVSSGSNGITVNFVLETVPTEETTTEETTVKTTQETTPPPTETTVPTETAAPTNPDGSPAETTQETVPESSETVAETQAEG